MLFALGVIFNFLIGGITGIFLADVPTDINLSNTYFVVAHFHYTIIGGELFALFAGDLLLVPEDHRDGCITRSWASFTSGSCSSGSTPPSCPCSNWAARDEPARGHV